jgi:peptidoglycan-associated lipoprotein
MLWVLSALLLFATGCPKKPPPPPEPAPVSVSSVSPSSGKANRITDVVVRGDGFAEGVQVRVGGRDATGVQWESGQSLKATFPDLAPGSYDVAVRNADGGRATLTGGFKVEAPKVEKPPPPPECGIVTVYFEFDQSVLTEDSRAKLKANADCIRSKGLGSVRLEGHADERGSTEYNLALGQRRAESARKFLVGLGLSPSSLSVISYGEEKPAAAGSSESSWSQNRRVEFAKQ